MFREQRGGAMENELEAPSGETRPWGAKLETPRVVRRRGGKTQLEPSVTDGTP